MYKINDSLVEREKKEMKSDRNAYVYILILLIIMLIVVFLNNAVYINIQVKGSSMYSTLSSEDMLLANKIKKPNYGDVVIVDCPKINGWIIKRVIGLGGDTVRIQGGNVYLTKKGGTEELLTETYITGVNYADNYDKKLEKEKVWEVPEGEMFLMGDNREHSSDSRYFGYFSDDQFIGVVENWAIRTKGIRNVLFKIFGVFGVKSCITPSGGV